MISDDSDILLEVRDLKTYFDVEGDGNGAKEVRAVDGASFVVRRGQILAIVGESGCGKSVTAYSILRLIARPGRIAGGQILLHPRGRETLDITALDEKSEELFDLRGGLISMIFQEPMSALSPVHTIGNQICEAILLHRNVGRKQARALAAGMLGKVGIPAPAERLRQYPHELSGGMRQRAVIAMALVCNPQLLIADEPTTALDVTIQAQILSVIKDLRKELNTSVLLITHDLGVVAQTADEVAVMYLGRIVEQAPIRPLMKRPAHPYTRGLLHSLPSLSRGSGRGAGGAKRQGLGRRSRLPSIPGSVPSPMDVPPGCPFHPRCRYAEAGRCDVGDPPELRSLPPGRGAPRARGLRKVACFRAEEIHDD